MYNIINTTIYTKGNSLAANGSVPWMTKKAIIIVNIIGIKANRYKAPNINPIEHASSAKIANPKEKVLPTPNGSGKVEDSS